MFEGLGLGSTVRLLASVHATVDDGGLGIDGKTTMPLRAGPVRTAYWSNLKNENECVMENQQPDPHIGTSCRNDVRR